MAHDAHVKNAKAVIIATDSDDASVLVALTGWGQPEDRSRSEAAGIDQHLVKPVDFSVLESLVDDASRETTGFSSVHR